MKDRVILCLFCCVLFVAIALPISSEDPLDERRQEASLSLDEAWQKISSALDGNLNTMLTALDEFEEAQEAAKPSHLDMLEARYRLLDIIHDSDDETVFDLYTAAQDYLRTVKEIDAMTDRISREPQGKALRGVALTSGN